MMVERKDLRVYETGTEPEYFVNVIRVKRASGNNFRVYAYAERDDLLHLLYTAVVPICALSRFGRQCSAATDGSRDVMLWIEDGREH